MPKTRGVLFFIRSVYLSSAFIIFVGSYNYCITSALSVELRFLCLGKPCAAEDIMFTLCPDACPDVVTGHRRFFSLCTNTERISMKFAGDNHYHRQMSWLHFWAKLYEGQGSRIRQNRDVRNLRCRLFDGC